MKLNVKQFLFCLIGALGIITTLVFRTPLKTQTDLMSIINIDSYQYPIDKISNKFSSMINIVVESKDEKSAQKYTNEIIQIIDDENFDVLHVQTNNFSLKTFVKDLIPYKNALISQESRELLKSGKTKQIADSAIKQVSESLMPPLTSLRDDPFLLLSDYILHISKTNQTWSLHNGLLWQYRDKTHYFMIPIDTDSTNASNTAQQINLLSKHIKRSRPENIKTYITGAPVHTALMVQKSQLQLGILSALALIMAIIFNYLLFRKLFTLIPVLTSLSVGFLYATIALFLCFSSPHILTFVFGTTLIGLGIDYSFHFITAATLKNKASIYKNMLQSYLTTIVCFVPLMLSNISLLQQISVFTIVGLTTIYIGLNLFMPEKIKLKVKPLKIKFRLSDKVKKTILSCILIAVCTTLPFVKTQNNISQFYRAPKNIVQQDLLFQKLNNSQKTNILLIQGRSIQDILETEEEIKLDGIDFISLSSFIPSIKTQIKNQELTEKLYKEQSKYLKKKLELKNTPVFEKSDFLSILNVKSEFINSWIDKLIIRDGGYIYSISQIAADANIAHKNAKVISVSDVISQQIQQYSIQTYYLLTFCMMCLIALLILFYRKRFFVYLMPSLIAILMSISILTWFGCPINFFHLLSFFIVIGLGLDYTIFNINADNDIETRPVLFSFLTSFVGFGLLSFTSFFLIKSMGITLGLGLGLSYVISLFLFRKLNTRKRR